MSLKLWCTSSFYEYIETSFKDIYILGGQSAGWNVEELNNFKILS